MTYRQARLKITIEQVLIFPFVLAGIVIGYLYPIKNKSKYFLFFPSDIIGGATKVNIDILNILVSHNPVVIFSKKYANTGFAKQFRLPGVTIMDLRNRIDNKAIYFVNIIYRGILAAWINQSRAKVVFGGESIYFYKVIPYVRKRTKVVELCHLNTWFDYSQAFAPYMDVRISSTPKIMRDMQEQYLRNDVPAKYLERLMFIDNWVDIPDFRRDEHPALNILFVGRGAAQKRVHIISRIAENIFRQNKDITFTFVGDVTKLLSAEVIAKAEIHEIIEDKNELYAIYDRSDILILTSSYEGLPIVVMDMMVRGRVILSTAVDGIPDYIRHKETGLLISELHDEDEIVRKACELILEMDKDRQQLKAIGDTAYTFAIARFTREKFNKEYGTIFDVTDNT